jgi:hypothetical protein
VCERLSIRERRTTAALGCLLYLSLIGYKAAVPYFTVSPGPGPGPHYWTGHLHASLIHGD